jgi:hypothetical protein
MSGALLHHAGAGRVFRPTVYPVSVMTGDGLL